VPPETMDRESDIPWLKRAAADVKCGRRVLWGPRSAGGTNSTGTAYVDAGIAQTNALPMHFRQCLSWPNRDTMAA
jgi:hypothetical protein